MLYDKIEKICVQAFLEKEENHETRFEFLQIQRIASFSLFLYVLDISEKPRRFFLSRGTLFSLFKSDGFYRRFSFKFGRISAAFVLKSVGIYGKIL